MLVFNCTLKGVYKSFNCSKKICNLNLLYSILLSQSFHSEHIPDIIRPKYERKEKNKNTYDIHVRKYYIIIYM